MELNKNIKYRNKYIILLLLFSLLIAAYILYPSNTPITQITEILNTKSQNIGQTSYFLVLEPDNLGNLKIKADVIDYNQSVSRIFSIIQNNPKPSISGDKAVYHSPLPKLVEK